MEGRAIVMISSELAARLLRYRQEKLWTGTPGDAVRKLLDEALTREGYPPEDE